MNTQATTMINDPLRGLMQKRDQKVWACCRLCGHAPETMDVSRDVYGRQWVAVAACHGKTEERIFDLDRNSPQTPVVFFEQEARAKKAAAAASTVGRATRFRSKGYTCEPLTKRSRQHRLRECYVWTNCAKDIKK